MKKLICLIFAATLFAPVILHAQLKFGIRGGIQDNVRMREIEAGDYEIDYKMGTIGFHFGVTSQLQIWKMYAQPEILFSTNSNSIKVTEYDGVNELAEEVGKQRFNKLDVPVLFGLKLDKLKIGFGPVFTAHLNSKSDLLNDEQLKYEYNNATVGYQIGLGLEGESFGVELRYEDNLSDYGTALVLPGGTKFDTDQRASQLMLSLVYYFGD